MDCKIIADFKQGLFCIDPVYGYMLGDPLEKLPSYFETWNELAKNMPVLVETKELRNKVNNMLLLDISKLNGHKEKCLAHFQLAIIGSGYVWQEGEEGVTKSIPKQLAIPWYRLSEELDLKAVLSYADIIIVNWGKKDENSNIRCLYNVTDGENAEWFVTVTVQIEFEFAAAIQPILQAIQAVSDSDTSKLNRCLCDINDVVQKMLEVFRRMNEKLTSEVFSKKMRPFLNGWGTEGNSLPEGLIYEGIDEIPKKFVGASAAQSSILQTLDTLLGIKHNKDKQMFLDKMKEYMPKPHRDFIAAIETSPKVRNYVVQSNEQELIESYNTCVQIIEKFRSYHMTIVTKLMKVQLHYYERIIAVRSQIHNVFRYIINTLSGSKTEEKFEKLSKRGTGGTPLIPFLKDIRHTTKEAKIKITPTGSET